MTPIASMFAYIAAQDASSWCASLTLILGVKTWSNAPLLQELLAHARSIAFCATQFVVCVSRPSDLDMEVTGKDVLVQSGRVNVSVLRRSCNGVDNASNAGEPPIPAEFYVCGPGSFMTAVCGAITEELGIDSKHVHTESFGSSVGPPTAPHNA